MNLFREKILKGESGAWVDFITNFASLPGLSAEKHFPLILEHRLPIDIVQPILHEMTHHWCFDSPVGGTLSLLRHQVRHALLASTLGRSIDPDDILDKLIRYEITIETLRPFCEGMALFAEHDALLDGKYTYSPPLHNSFSLAGKDYIPEIKPGRLSILPRDYFTQAINRAFHDMRLHQSGVNRKADLLVSPLDAAKSPYLLGYMAIKGIWAATRRRGTLFNPDQFLSYCRSYIFQDYGLIAEILADTSDHQSICNNIINYILTRVNRLVISDIKDDVKLWDSFESIDDDWTSAEVLPNGIVKFQSKPPQLPGLGVSPNATMSGYTRLMESHKWLDHSGESDPILFAHKRQCAHLLALRSIMPICSTPAIANEINGKTVVTSPSGSALATLDPLTPGKSNGEGILDYYQLLMHQSNSPSHIVVMLVDNKPVATTSREEWSSASKDLISMLTPSPEQQTAIAISDGFDSAAIGEKHDYINNYLEHIQNSMPGILKSIYLPPASLIYTGTGNHLTALEKFRTSGIFDIIKGDIDMIYDLARLSIIANQAITHNQANIVISSNGGDLKKLLQYLETIEKESNIRFIMKSDDIIISMI